MGTYIKDNSIIIELTESEATIARKVFPIFEPFLTAIAKDLIGMGLSLVVSMKDFIEQCKSTNTMPSKYSLLSEVDGILNLMKHIRQVDMIDVNALMKVAEIDLEDLK